MQPSLSQLFRDVAPSYDLLNRLVSLGLDRRLRRGAALECLAGAPRRALDLCCGTGDLAIELGRLNGSRLELVGLDGCETMLELAEKKARRAGVEVRWVLADAAELPFPDGAFDCVGIAFAFRNLTWRNPRAERHLEELARVVAPGGRCVIVETGQPRSGAVRMLLRAYLRAYVEPIGWAISGHRPAYRYLARSIANFYDARGVRDLLLGAGFREVRYYPRLFGAIGIHVAVR